MSSIAAQIEAYVEAQLARVRVGNTITRFDGSSYSFQTDAGETVLKNLEFTERPDVLPCLAYYSGSNTAGYDGPVAPENGMEAHLLDIRVEGFIAETDKRGTEGDKLRQDLVAALRSDPQWDDLIDLLVEPKTETAIQIGEEVFTIVSFTATACYQAPHGSE